MRKKSTFSLELVISIWLFFSISCTRHHISQAKPINYLHLQDRLFVNHHVDKACYAFIDKTFYLMHKSENAIYIYKQGQLWNIIGGPGFGESNFRRLTDINLGADGTLYALDSSERSLKKFDRTGKYQGQVLLTGTTKPSHFAISSTGGIFIYDNYLKEIAFFDYFSLNVKYTFGKFQIESCDELYLIGDFINIYSKPSNSTTIFFVNGLYENSYQGKMLVDSYHNLYLIAEKSIIEHFSQKQLINLQNDHHQQIDKNSYIELLNFDKDFLLINHNQEIQVYRLIYTS